MIELRRTLTAAVVLFGWASLAVIGRAVIRLVR